jgi:transposase
MSYLPRPVRCEREESEKKINKQSQKNIRFTWFTAKGYVHRVAANFSMMEKIIQKTFTT